MTTPDPRAVDAEVRRMFGEVAAFLDHSELGPVLRKAAAEGWDTSRLFGALQQTSFWRTTGEDARKWTILKTLDPATADARAQQQTIAVAQMARDAGFEFTPEQQRYFAELSLKNGWSGQQTLEHLRAREANNAVNTGNLDTAVSISYGYLAAFLDTPEVGDLLRMAARQGWSQARLEVELQKTSFWKTTTQAQRQWDALKEQNPQDAQGQALTREAEIDALAKQIGVRLDPADLKKIADDSIRFGWAQTQIRSAVAAEYEYSGGTEKVPAADRMNQGAQRKGGLGGRTGGRVDAAAQAAGTQQTPRGEEFGLAAQTAREVRERAAQYLVPISPQMMERWTEQMVRGETDMEGFNAYLVEQAKSLFPGMAGALDRGVTVAQYADPYRQMAARELEMAPESVDLADPRFRQMLDQRDNKGNRVAMTLSESAEYLRKMPEWQQTRGANEKAAALTESILQRFGAVA